jgi:hypothetical protein
VLFLPSFNTRSTSRICAGVRCSLASEAFTSALPRHYERFDAKVFVGSGGGILPKSRSSLSGAEFAPTDLSLGGAEANSTTAEVCPNHTLGKARANKRPGRNRKRRVLSLGALWALTR